MRSTITFVGFILLFVPSVTKALDIPTTLLHTFTGQTDDGGARYGAPYGGPYGSLAQDTSTLYGSTSGGGTGGGTGGNGVVFSIGKNGSGFTVLHSFTGGSGGDRPYGSVTLNGSTLYGTTEYGGTSDNGVVFSIGTNGNSFTNVHTFNGTSDGSMPAGTIVVSGSTLYGVATRGGTNGAGTIWAVGTNGTGFEPVYTFNAPTDGGTPYGLTFSGSTLYGVAYSGGPIGGGTVFSFDTVQKQLNVLHPFGATNDGFGPQAELALIGSTLFGKAGYGGKYGGGIVFRIDINGSNYQVLHDFPDPTVTGDGAGPVHGALAVMGSQLLGMTQQGGSSSGGTIFKIGTDGTLYTLVSRISGGLLGRP
jgi:uncharacterized repeat protein (TIGR03803 family)